MATINDCVGDLTTDGNGTQADLTFTGLDPFDLLDGKYLQLTLLIDDVSKIGNLFVYIGADDVAASHVRWRFDAATAASRIGRSGEEFRVTLQLAEIDAAQGDYTLSTRGAVSPVSGFTSMRFRAVDDATGPITVRLLRTRLVTPTRRGAYVSMAFDDGYLSQFEIAAPRLEMYNLRGSIYPSLDKVGESGYGKPKQLRDLDAAGWEIGGHHSVEYTSVSADELREMLDETADWLRTYFGDKPIGLAYPGGKYESTTDGVSVEMLVSEAGFSYGRTILAEVGVPTNCQVNAVVPIAPYRLRAASSVSSAASSGSPVRPDRLIGPGGMLDRIETNGGWLILVFHRIVTGTAASTVECSEVDLASIVDALVDRPGITVAPVREVLLNGKKSV